MTLTFDQFRYGFANAVSEEEAHELYEQFHVAGSGVPLFQAAFANLNPATEVKAEKTRDDRGPMLVISGELDHQAPHAIAKATYDAQLRNEHFPTEFTEIPGRGHSLTIDSGWQEVAAHLPRVRRPLRQVAQKTNAPRSIWPNTDDLSRRET